MQDKFAKQRGALMKKNLFLLTSSLLLGILSMPFASAATTQSAAGDYLKLLVDGIAGLFRGNTNLFVRDLTAAFPLIAVFLIVMAVVQYVSRRVLFKEPENARFAAILSVGMALITVWSQGVFSWIVGLGITTLTIIFIFVFIAFLYEGIASHQTGLVNINRANRDLSTARKEVYETQKGEIRAKEDFTAEMALEGQEIQDLKNAQEEIRSMSINSKSIQNSLNKIQGQLRNLIRIGSDRPESVVAYRNALSSELGFLESKLEAERANLGQLWEELQKYKYSVQSDFRTMNAEQRAIADINAMIRKYSGSTPLSIGKIRSIKSYTNRLRAINEEKMKFARDDIVKAERDLNLLQTRLITAIRDSVTSLHNANYPQAELDIQQALKFNNEVQVFASREILPVINSSRDLNMREGSLLNQIINEISKP